MIVIVALMGLAVGSFLNVCIDRLPARQSLVTPRSHCDACGRPLASRDMIPVVSYLLLHGRCRYCSATIPRRVPLVEVAAGLTFAGWWWYLGQSWLTALATTLTCALIVIALIGMEHRPLIERTRRM